MQNDYEKQLEAAVRRELEGLTDLPAPPELASRVMRKLELEAAPAVWYQRSWPAWPATLRVASVIMLVAALGAVCLGVSQAAQTSLFITASESIGNTLTRFDVVARTLQVVLNSLKLAFDSLGSLLIAGWVMAGVVCYAVCVGVGTVCYRLAFVRH